MWVLFNADGSPRWIGPDQVIGAEWVEGVDEKTLLSCRRVDGKWIMRDPVKAPEPEETPPNDDAIAIVEAARRLAYQQYADPLFFKWQAGEATEEEWRAAREDVRKQNPMPERNA